MNQNLIRFLQVVIVLIGIGTLVLMLLGPHFEGRNVDATVFQIYFDDPFLAYAYMASIVFFVALYKAFKLLGYVGRSEGFSQQSVGALRTIQHCGMSLAVLIAAPVAYLLIVRPEDDIAGGVVTGLFLIFISAVIGTASAVFAETLQNAIDIKSENESLI